MRTALVTGSHGFIGSYVRKVLHDRGWGVVGLGRADRRSEAAVEGERYVRADLTDTVALTAALGSIEPDVVFHLAASPRFKQAGAADVTELMASTVAGTFSLMAALASGGRSLVVVVGSSAQYGPLPREANPVAENAPCNPITPYGWGKAAAEATACAFAAAGVVDVIPVRVFNVVGPGEPSTTVASAFAERIAAVLDGRAEEVHARDLEAVRDFTDVRDVAAGLVDVAERGVPGRLYNLCSGRATSVGDVLDGLLAAAGLDRSVVRVLPDTGAAQIPYQVGSPARVAADVGWSATTELSASLRALLESTREALAR